MIFEQSEKFNDFDIIMCETCISFLACPMYSICITNITAYYLKLSIKLNLRKLTILFRKIFRKKIALPWPVDRLFSMTGGDGNSSILAVALLKINIKYGNKMSKKIELRHKKLKVEKYVLKVE